MLIAHISDLHLNCFYNESNYLRLNYLLKKIQAEKVDHLIITGDVTDNASEQDFISLKKLLNKYDYLKGEKLTIIVGNHDIFGGIQRAEDIFSFPEKCRGVNYNQKLNEFTGYFPESLENCFFISSNGYYPFAKIIDNVLIIGINSIAYYSKLNNPFSSNGEVGIAQFNEVYSLLGTNLPQVKYKLILIHHHFNKVKVKARSSLGNVWQNIEKQTMKLKNKRRLFNLFNEFNVDLVLHGHLHESKEYYRKGIRFLNAGGTLKSEKGERIIINFIKLSNKKIVTNIEHINSPIKEPVFKLNNHTDDFVRLINYSTGNKEKVLL